MNVVTYIDKIENKLINSFDIMKGYSINDINYDLYGKYHFRNEKYLLTKKAVIYAIENNEYVLIKHYKGLNAEDYHIFIDNLVNSVEMIVNLSKEHMSSIITGIILVDDISNSDFEYIKNSVRKFKYSKSFAFGFKGWVDIRLILVSLKNGIISANKKGKEVEFIYNI